MAHKQAETSLKRFWAINKCQGGGLELFHYTKLKKQLESERSAAKTRIAYIAELETKNAQLRALVDQQQLRPLATLVEPGEMLATTSAAVGAAATTTAAAAAAAAATTSEVATAGATDGDAANGEADEADDDRLSYISAVSGHTSEDFEILDDEFVRLDVDRSP